jgi:hypothetical protein
VFETGPFRLKGKTTIPLKETIKDPTAAGC